MGRFYAKTTTLGNYSGAQILVAWVAMASAAPGGGDLRLIRLDRFVVRPQVEADAGEVHVPLDCVHPHVEEEAREKGVAWQYVAAAPTIQQGRGGANLASRSGSVATVGAGWCEAR